MDFHFDTSLQHGQAPSDAAQYAVWLNGLKPRTCLLVHWLATLGAIHDPGRPTHERAHRFAAKRGLLGRLVDHGAPDVAAKTARLIENAEFDLYVAYLMWLRFNEYVPRRFVVNTGRARVLAWMRQQLNRPELTDEETEGELRWQVERICAHWDNENDPKQLFAF